MVNHGLIKIFLPQRHLSFSLTAFLKNQINFQGSLGRGQQKFSRTLKSLQEESRQATFHKDRWVTATSCALFLQWQRSLTELWSVSSTKQLTKQVSTC